MKEQIIESLKQTYSAKYGADDSFISGQADAILATGVTEENMANAVAGVESSFRAYQSFQDKHRAEKARLEKELEELKKASQTPPPSDPPKPTDPPKDDNEVLKYLKEMRAEMESLKTQTEAQRKEKAKNDLLASTTAFFANAKHLNKANLDTAMEFCYMTVNESSTEEELKSAVIAKYDELQSRHGGLDKYVAIPASGGGKERPEKKWAAEAEKRKAQANK